MQISHLFLSFVIACVTSSSAFVTQQHKITSNAIHMGRGGGYRKMLKRAKANGPKKQTSSLPEDSQVPAPAVPNTPSGSKQAWESRSETLSIKAKNQFKNQVPFSNEMYETIKTAVELLSGRSDASNPAMLTSEEANWFADAVEAIIEDANMYGPPKPPTKGALSSEERANSG